MSRLRVLQIAEMAGPERTSVPLEGWSHGRALAELTDAHLVTQVRHREEILRAGLREGDDFTAIDSERIAARLHAIEGRLRGGAGKGWTTVMALRTFGYYYFERLVWKRFGSEIRSGAYDLVHRITPLSPTTPSLIAGKCRRAGVPFVMGPINGGVPWPRGFGAERRKEQEWLSYVRGAHKLMPGYRATRRNAAAIIIGSRDTFAQMPRRYHDRCVYVPENAIDPERFTARAAGPVTAPIGVAFVGRLVPYKGADMLLEAAAPLVRAGRVRIDIIGDGPEMPVLRGIAEREEIAGGVRLDGWVPHRELQHRLVRSDVFAFPSVREFGGAVVLEAMALGLVPVIVDYAGPAELVTESTGYTVPIGPRDSIVRGFRARLETLCDRPEEVRPTGEQARRRVHAHFTWPAKARQVLEVYRWATGHRPDKPDFGMPLPDEPS